MSQVTLVLSVSAIIPCYNAAPYVAESVASALGQTRPPDELIVVDDGSDDDSAAIARRAGARVVRLERNVGGAAARNAGLRAARGDVVAWLDADDVWEDGHLESVVPLLERFPSAALAFSRVRLFGNRSGEWPALIPEQRPVMAFPEALRRVLPPHNTVVVRRDLLLAEGGYDESMRIAIDYDLWLRLARRYPFVCTHAITCRWRHHGRNISRNLADYQRCEYECRWRLWRRVVEESAEHDAGHDEAWWDDGAALADALRDVWLGHLESAWWSRDRTQMDFHLTMRDLVPGSAPHVAAWRRREQMIPQAVAYDKLRTGARACRAAVTRS